MLQVSKVMEFEYVGHEIKPSKIENLRVLFAANGYAVGSVRDIMPKL